MRGRCSNPKFVAPVQVARYVLLSAISMGDSLTCGRKNAIALTTGGRRRKVICVIWETAAHRLEWIRRSVTEPPIVYRQGWVSSRRPVKAGGELSGSSCFGLMRH